MLIQVGRCRRHQKLLDYNSDKIRLMSNDLQLQLRYMLIQVGRCRRHQKLLDYNSDKNRLMTYNCKEGIC